MGGFANLRKGMLDGDNYDFTASLCAGRFSFVKMRKRAAVNGVV